MTLEQLIAQVNSEGKLVNNLFQTATGWRASLRDATHGFEFGEGATPEAALAQALVKLDKDELINKPVASLFDAPKQVNSLEDLGL